MERPKIMVAMASLHKIAPIVDPTKRLLLREMFDVAVASVSADLCLPARLPDAARGKTFILAVGKAGAAMARTAAQRMGGRIEGVILTRYGHGLPPGDLPQTIEQIEAGHPLPDERGLEAAQRIFAAVSALGPDDQLLALISGGGSALLALPAPGVSLEDKRKVTDALLRCGAPISEINCVRKHLSAIKGGRLAVAAAPAKVVTLAFSDIPGDDPALISSGPTIMDRTTLADARKILDHYEITPPESVARALENPANETPNGAHPAFANPEIRVVARSKIALDAAGQLAKANGYSPVYLGDDIEGDATDLGAIHAALALHHQRKGGRWALLSGGETTVVVRNAAGRGGRNAEYLLSLAIGLGGARGVTAIACDTDGIDGTEDNAGAVIDPATLDRAAQLNIEPNLSLQRNEAYALFEALNDLVVTGPTRTNVNDFRAILIDS